ncbi:MAG TPA: hypothetical protein PKD48_01825 [Sphingopyxis sp.]|nr:hypothetical protein [Sphingopyxis sp.]
MSDMSAACLVWSFGFVAGFAYRVCGERLVARYDDPAWIARLGYSLVEQFKSVDDGHKFAGSEMSVISRKFYSDGSKSFMVKVERERSHD